MTVCKPRNISSDEGAVTETGSLIALGEFFIGSLAAQNFTAVKQLFQPAVRFRAMVPSGERTGATDSEAAGWLERWFGSCDTLQLQQSSASLVFDRLYLNYRFRLHSQKDNWQVIEQHVYCVVQNSQIADLWLLCSGFRPDHETGKDLDDPSRQASQSHLGGDVFYNAGSRGCSEGPMDDIAAIMRQLKINQTLEIYATDPSVGRDLPAWCRMSGNEFVKQEADSYLIRHK
jgi:TusA-related sulfurtransferase